METPVIVGFKSDSRSHQTADAVPAEEALDGSGVLRPGYARYFREVSGGTNFEADSSYFYRVRGSGTEMEVGV